MSPSHTMSAHWGKQIYTSWRQSRQGGSSTTAAGPHHQTSPLPSPSGLGLPAANSGYFGPEKRSMDSDRSNSNAAPSGAAAAASPMSRQSSASSWFGRRQ